MTDEDIEELKQKVEDYKTANKLLLQAHTDLTIENAALRAKVEIYEAFLKGEKRHER